MIFDVKMEDIQRKVRMVSGVIMTDVPPRITYASVLYHEISRIALTMAELNDMSAKTANIVNT